MGLFNFWKKDKTIELHEGCNRANTSQITTDLSDGNRADRSNWRGVNFEFLIEGDIDIPDHELEKTMTPNSFEWKKVSKSEGDYYLVGEDRFCYSWELPGIQMTFNPEIHFSKAKNIADEVIENLESMGKHPVLVLIDSKKVYKFE